VHRPLLVVLVADRRAEAGDQEAALVAGGHLTEMPTVAVDHPHRGGQEALQGGDRSWVVHGEIGHADEGDGDLAVLVDEVAPSGAQPLGDGRMEEGGQPPGHALIERVELAGPHRWDPSVQAADHLPAASALQDLGAEAVPEQRMMRDDLARSGLMLSSRRAVERRPGQHIAESDRRVPP
jgi:hypothetical protein